MEYYIETPMASQSKFKTFVGSFERLLADFSPPKLSEALLVLLVLIYSSLNTINHLL